MHELVSYTWLKKNKNGEKGKKRVREVRKEGANEGGREKGEGKKGGKARHRGRVEKRQRRGNKDCLFQKCEFPIKACDTYFHKNTPLCQKPSQQVTFLAPGVRGT